MATDMDKHRQSLVKGNLGGVCQQGRVKAVIDDVIHQPSV